MAFLYFLTLSAILGMLFSLLAYSTSLKINFIYDSLSPFECGFFSTPEFRPSISLHFFLIALIFLIFDLELIFLFPFLVKTSTHFSKVTMIMLEFFLLGLTAGTIYEWNQENFLWNSFF